MISNEQITHIAKLARLRVEPENVAKTAAELESILGYVTKLQELDTEGVPELAHGDGLVNVFRADVASGFDQDERKRVIAAFPHREGELLEVPAVFQDRTE